MNTVKGFKVFNPDWTCKEFQYEVGEVFTHNGDIEINGSGFHFCNNAAACFNYYPFNGKNKVAEVEAVGFVKTQDNIIVTNKIKIIREIKWQELLAIANDENTDESKTNTDDYNIGNDNTGYNNCGDGNTDYGNVGDNNTGMWNRGDRNVGISNTGDGNTGDWNIGEQNAGDWNNGNYNTGKHNIGDHNTGDWNSTNFSTGFFNTEQQQIYMFNKPVDMSRSDICKLQGIRVLNMNYKNSTWVYAKDMSDDEKIAHPEYEITGGYLRTIDVKTACKMMWNRLSCNEKSAVMQLPNFDAKIFEDIAGINVNENK